MIQSRLKTVIICNLFFFVVGLGLLAPNFLFGEGLDQGRHISMVAGDPHSPEWKILWDQARSYSRQENYPLAVLAYGELYGLKSNIEEANWEYCQVLLQVEDYQLAGKIIGGLLEKDPNNSDYLLAAGAIAASGKRYDEAIQYYGQVFEKTPAGVLSDSALLGMASSLRNRGKKQYSFVLLEKYLLRHPENQQVLHHLAMDALELGQKAKARDLYSRLLEAPYVDDRIIFQAIQAFDQQGFEEKRNGLWLQYLKRHPDYLPFRKEISQYYLGQGEYEAALLHISYLADNVEDNGRYLLQAAALCRHNLNRPDKALHYLERYRKNHPESIIVRKKISDVQDELARSLLVLVENDRASQLWRDLEKVTVNRQQLYFKIADLLEKRGQIAQLIQVLEILYKESSPSTDLALRLADQYQRLGVFDMELWYLKKISGKKNKNKAFFLKRGVAELHLGLEMDALVSFEAALVLTPDDRELRSRCLKLAGKIGDTAKLKSIFQPVVNLDIDGIQEEFVFNYLNLLKFNYLFQEYDKTYRWAIKKFHKVPALITSLEIGRAEVLRKEGKKRQAEQLLRQLLSQHSASKGEKTEILFLLAENALMDKEYDKAEEWFEPLEQAITGESSENQKNSGVSLSVGRVPLLLLRARLLEAGEKYSKALDLIEEYQLASKENNISGDQVADLLALKKFQCWLAFLNKDYRKSYLKLTELLSDGGFDPKLWILGDKIKKHLTDKEQIEISNYNSHLFRSTAPVLSNILALAALQLDLSHYGAARDHAQIVLDNFPDSVAAKNILVESLIGLGKGGRSLETLSQLSQRYPDEEYFVDKVIDIETRRGGYKEGLSLLAQKSRADNLDQMIESLGSKDDPAHPADLLRLARLLWGDKKQKKALGIYRHLLAEPVLKQLSDEFRRKQIDPPYYTGDNTLWDSMLGMLQSEPKVLDGLMAPPFLVENLGNETGGIVARYFERYSWQTLISNEYIARKAIYDRNYYYAEQSFKRLMQEEPQEGMLDLATIYGKIGKYRKEAQVYQAIQESGTSSLGLSESIERNSLQLSPKNIINVGYFEQQGRDGNIDMAQISLGTSFEFTPDLDTEVSLSYENNHFESLGSGKTAKSDLVYGLVTYEMIKGYELLFGAGVEKLSGDSDSGYLYKLGLTGQLDDYVDAYLQIEKKQVYDTVPAIEEQVTYQAIEMGLNIETPLGLAFGGDLQHRYYNDSNSQNRFHGYSTYTLFKESLRLGVRYDYLYLISEDDNGPGKSVQQTDDLLYWSPSSFSEHRLGFSLQQDFLGFELDKKKSFSYWVIESGIGLEDNKNLSFTTKLDIFLEMSPHYLLKGNLTVTESDAYKEKGISMSLHYRW